MIMLLPARQCLAVLGLISVALGRPRDSPRSPASSGDDDDHVHAPNPVFSTISPPSSTGAPPAEVTEGATQLIDTNSYWWIDGSCAFDKTPDGELKYDYLKEAFQDATEIANVAKQWPGKFTGTSDLYIGKNFHISKYSADFRTNLEKAAGWQHDTSWPFQSYVRVSCRDAYNCCGNKIGSDPRGIAAYANNTKSTFGSPVWRITACDLFFTRNTLKLVKRFHESTDKADMQMIFMETSGEAFLHEAMHLTAISENRAKIIDATFDGGKRIYGPRDVAKGARIANRDGFDIVSKNADTYAVFAQAAYWEDYYGLVIPPVQTSKSAPAGIKEDQSVQDSQDNYVQFVMGDDSSNGNSSAQLIAIASYINPLADSKAWDRLIDYPNNKLPVLVANVVNGPDSTADTNWKSVISRAAAAGKTVIGYVRTGYLSLNAAYTPDFLPYKTRLGSTELADWVAQIEHDVDMWYELYGTSMGGIFFDEGWMECGPNNIYADVYKYINDYTKRKHPGAYTVLNPGSPIASCYEDTMDTLLTFELSYEAYTGSYKGNDWTAKDPRKIWHIVYNVPQSGIDQVAKLAKERGAGIIQITNDVMPNPYDNLPDESYMSAHLAAVSGGNVPVADAHPWPSSGGSAGGVSSLVVAHSDYSSAALKWNAASNALGYHIYDNGNMIASVPGSMTSITIGGLQPGSSHSFIISAVGSGGTTGSSSPSASTTTLSLPGGKSVNKYSASVSAGSTTIKADILVPYAFLRIYIWDSVECDFQHNPGWPINFKSDAYVCTHYMVEDKKFFKYTGDPLPEGKTDATWTWTNITDKIPIDINGYTYTWTLPIGSSITDTSKFVVQAQGYGPYINVFDPLPDDYDCKGSSMCGSTANLGSWCDTAAANISDSTVYTSDGGSKSGTCSGNTVQACGVFVQKFGGGTCSMTGTELHAAYDNIRKVGGCKKCGSYHRSDGCLATVNYVTFCPTDKQPGT